jgi:EAL domain-containing protein (putative c-di-GMP-specific phosphodiesterase class I)
MTHADNKDGPKTAPTTSLWARVEEPLELVVGLADMLRDRTRDVSAAARNEMIDQVASRARAAKRALDDVVLSSRLATDEIEFESDTVDLREVAESVIEGWSLGHGARVTVSGSVQALGDERWVAHIIWNLLLDSVDRGGRNIEVRVTEAFTKATVQVVDDGSAPSLADLEAFAAPYDRNMAADWSGSTLGRGVALARGLAKAMGGELRCFSDDQLTTFELSMRKQSTPTGRRVPLPDTEVEPRSQPSREDITSLLENGDISMVYQPVVDMRTDVSPSSTIGYESLARFPHSTPPDWFKSAGSAGMGLELELLAIRVGIDGFSTRDQDSFLALNLSNATLLASRLLTTLEGIDPGRLVLELSDTARIRSYELTRRAVDALRERGVRLAVDDVGSGEIDMWHILRLDPEIIKLDRTLVADQQNVRRNSALIHGLTTMANDMGIMVIAEAVETEAERMRLLELGVEFGQGYLFGKPSALQWKTRVLSDVSD